MADTLFTSGTVVASSWLNEVNTDTHALLTSVAGGNTITATGPVSMTGYATGQRFFFNPAANNTTNVTININGLGARAITKLGNILLVAQDLLVGTMAEIVYDGAGFQLLNPQSVNLTQIIPVTNGGTGATTAADARTNLGLGTLATLNSPVPVADGGTAGTTTATALFNLGAGVSNRATSGYTRLPGGLIFQWGTGTTAAGGGLAVALPVAFAANAYSGGATVQAVGVSATCIAVSLGSATTITVFICNTAGAGVASPFTWWAIGPA